ncbi:MAG: hypothetical protein GY699_21905 [Desulfobacteraceae bacterium]|nr:hypothetical protein [Desulfobacteraceae bacterium]
MKYPSNLKYSLVGWAIAAGIGFGISAVSSLPFWAAFIIVAISMHINSLIAEYEDNLPSGFNNPMSEKEIKVETQKRIEQQNKKLLPYRITFWGTFILILICLVWVLCY